jgi:hypothetical protein
MDFTSYGFKQKFVKNASYNNDPIFKDLRYEKGYIYIQDNGKSLIEARLEIYEGKCLPPEIFHKDLETLFKNVNGNSNFYNDWKVKTFYYPFSWLHFKAQGSRKNIEKDEYRGFLNAYLSTNYFVLVIVFMINYDYWDIGYEIVADKTTGDSFIPIDITQKLHHLGLSVKAQGSFSIHYNDSLKAYYFIPCTEIPDDNAFFILGELKGAFEQQYSLRLLDYLNAIHNNEKFEVTESNTEIPWTDKGKLKFKNGQREINAFYRLDKNNNKNLQYEVFYEFEYLGKKYLLFFKLYLKKDSYLYAFEDSDLNTPRNKTDVLNYYEKNIIRILETLEKM